jgi:dihydropteroate synthase
MKLVARGATWSWPRLPLIMGIVNLCHDSFCHDGIIDVDEAVKLARTLVADGADIIDVGAESARTNRAVMEESEEAGKLCEFIERWQEPVPLSINTWRPAVVSATLSFGGAILNDIGGLPDDHNARVCAETGAALLIMHTRGAPKVAHTHVQYDDVIADLDAFFVQKIRVATQAGVAHEALLLDPGIDFAKQTPDNLRILGELAHFQHFGRPILLPISRKTTIGDVLGVIDPRERDAGTVACVVHGMLGGAAIFRVHNVRAAAQAVRMIARIEMVR